MNYYQLDERIEEHMNEDGTVLTLTAMKVYELRRQ